GVARGRGRVAQGAVPGRPGASAWRGPPRAHSRRPAHRHAAEPTPHRSGLRPWRTGRHAHLARCAGGHPGHAGVMPESRTPERPASGQSTIDVRASDAYMSSSLLIASCGWNVVSYRWRAAAARLGACAWAIGRAVAKASAVGGTTQPALPTAYGMPP